jgi:hypothetical protein
MVFRLLFRSFPSDVFVIWKEHFSRDRCNSDAHIDWRDGDAIGEAGLVVLGLVRRHGPFLEKAYFAALPESRHQ